MTMTATYSPEDNKLRLYPSSRLPAETYAALKAAGFKWAPRQELFVAPMWTPDREDLLVELCGEIGDEDTSLTERAEERADRFEDYSESREREARAAKAAVDAVADAIPFGQPILVGHHSERHARRDAERIRSGMAKAVGLWRTSQYWTERAAGAIRHAKYKELPSVRARRIKKIEADRRREERAKAEAEKLTRLWTNPEKELTPERAAAIANHDHIHCSFSLAEYPRELPASQYEGPMSLWSALTGGVISPEKAREIAVAAHGRTVERAGRWIEHYDNRLAYERAMLGESGGTAADRNKPEKGGAVRCWCSPGYGKGWSYVKKVNKVSVTVEDNFGNGGKNFTRTVPFDKLAAVMSKADVDAAKAAGRLADSAFGDGFFLKDEPVKERPAYKAPEPTEFDALEDALKAGVKVVSAPQLFPTPPDVARQVVGLAGIEGHMTVLEPSAGTGSLVRAVREAAPEAYVQAVEINPSLAAGLRSLPVNDIRCGDFLTTAAGEFDRVVMNPPFADAADIRHVEHALAHLKEGGRLVSVVANGPRQREKLMPLATAWVDLPEGTFAGTGVRAAICVIDK
jgi:protein-L-isoaspartate O-methyltransferase